MINKFKVFTFFSISLLLFSPLISCANTPSISTSSPQTPTQAFQIPSTYITYTDETNLFSVSYPKDWESIPNFESKVAQAREAINNLNNGLPVARTAVLYMAGLKVANGYLLVLAVAVTPLVPGVSEKRPSQ